MQDSEKSEFCAAFLFFDSMNKPKITMDDYKREAARLRCAVADIETVAQVESKGEAFYADGFPTILFERHKFHHYTNGEFDRKYPRISNPVAGGYGKAGQNQRDKFNLAFLLNPIAAMMSCSWGKFQLMGFNFKLCGFDSVGAFVDAMKESEGAHLAAFSNFVISCGLSDELRNHRWARFAQGYNGAKYKENHYDEKLAEANAKFSKEKTSLSTATPDAAASEGIAQISSQQSVDAADDPQDDSATNSGESVNQTTPQNNGDAPANQTAENITNVNNGDKTVPDNFTPENKTIPAPPPENSTATAMKLSVGGFAVPLFLVPAIKAVQSAMENGFIDAKQVGDAVMTFITGNTKYFFGLIGLTIVGLILRKAWKQLTFLLTIYTTARGDMHNITVVGQQRDAPTDKLSFMQRITGKI